MNFLSATPQNPLLISNLITYSSVRGSFYLSPSSSEYLEVFSRKTCNKLKAKKMRLPCLLSGKLLKLEKKIGRGFQEECYKLNNQEVYLKPTSELLLVEYLQKNPSTSFPFNVYCDGPSYRNETNQTAPGIRHTEILFFMEGHYFTKDLEDSKNRFKFIEKIYDKILKKENINHIKTQRVEEDRFPGSKRTIAYDYLTSSGKSLQIATIHDLGTTFTEKVGNFKDITYHLSYGMSERILFAKIDSLYSPQEFFLPSYFQKKEIIIKNRRTGNFLRQEEIKGQKIFIVRDKQDLLYFEGVHERYTKQNMDSFINRLVEKEKKTSKLNFNLRKKDRIIVKNEKIGSEGIQLLGINKKGKFVFLKK
jgi:prolyl-tRNA synthetase